MRGMTKMKHAKGFHSIASHATKKPYREARANADSGHRTWELGKDMGSCQPVGFSGRVGRVHSGIRETIKRGRWSTAGYAYSGRSSNNQGIALGTKQVSTHMHDVGVRSLEGPSLSGAHSHLNYCFHTASVSSQGWHNSCAALLHPDYRSTPCPPCEYHHFCSQIYRDPYWCYHGPLGHFEGGHLGFSIPWAHESRQRVIIRAPWLELRDQYGTSTFLTILFSPYCTTASLSLYLLPWMYKFHV
jgi:hypothetical protein